MTARPAIVRAGLTVAFGVLADVAIHACPICFQIEDAHVVGGVRAAVAVLMGVTAAVMAPVIVFAVKFARRQNGPKVQGSKVPDGVTVTHG